MAGRNLLAGKVKPVVAEPTKTETAAPVEKTTTTGRNLLARRKADQSVAAAPTPTPAPAPAPVESKKEPLSLFPLSEKQKASLRAMDERQRKTLESQPEFIKQFQQTFNPIEAITKEGIIPQAGGYVKKLVTGEKFEEPKKAEKEISVTEAIKGLKNYAASNPGGFVGTVAQAIVADPELLLLPEFAPVRLYKAAQQSGKIATTTLKAADAATQAAAISAAHSITKQLNETGTVDMSKVGRDTGAGALLTGGTVLGLKGVTALGRGTAKTLVGATQLTTEQLAKNAEKLGFKLEPGQLRADKPIGTPGFRESDKIKNENIASKLVTEQTGRETTEITPAFINERKTALGKAYDRIFNRKFNIDSTDAQKFTAMRNFEASVAPAGNRNVAIAANNLIGRWNREYISQLSALIESNTKKLIQQQGRGGVAPITRLKKDWTNVRASDAADAPAWAKDVESAIHDLSAKLGLKETPKVWFSKPRARRGGGTLYGMATGEGGHIVINDSLDRMGGLATGLHEFGHQAEFQMFVHQSPEVRAQIIEAWQRQMKELPFGKLTVEQHRPITAEKYGEAGRTAIPEKGYERKYLRNFQEWYAEQTSRWITQTKAPTTVVENYFKKVADVWKAIYSRVTGYLPMAQEVDAFYRSRWKGDTLSELTAPTERRLASEGEDPNIILDPSDVTAAIDGTELQRLRSHIADIARSHQDGQVRRVAGQYVEQIDAMIEKSHPELLKELQKTNRQYAATLTLQDGIERGFISQGKISLKGLGDYLAGSNQVQGFGSGTSRHPLYELGYMGRELNMTSRVEGAKLPEYDTIGALFGRGRQLLGSTLGTRGTVARELQRRYASPEGVPAVPAAPYAPYAGPLTQQGVQYQLGEEERNRMLSEALMSRFGRM